MNIIKQKNGEKEHILNEKLKTRSYSSLSLFQGLIIIAFVSYNIDFLIDIHFFIFFHSRNTAATTYHFTHIITETLIEMGDSIKKNKVYDKLIDTFKLHLYHHILYHFI